MSYSWTFDSEQAGTGQEVLLDVKSGGKHTVRLTVTNSYGSSYIEEEFYALRYYNEVIKYGYKVSFNNEKNEIYITNAETGTVTSTLTFSGEIKWIDVIYVSGSTYLVYILDNSVVIREFTGSTLHTYNDLNNPICVVADDSRIYVIDKGDVSYLVFDFSLTLISRTKYCVEDTTFKFNSFVGYHPTYFFSVFNSIRYEFSGYTVTLKDPVSGEVLASWTAAPHIDDALVASVGGDTILYLLDRSTDRLYLYTSNGSLLGYVVGLTDARIILKQGGYLFVSTGSGYYKLTETGSLLGFVTDTDLPLLNCLAVNTYDGTTVFVTVTNYCKIVQLLKETGVPLMQVGVCGVPEEDEFFVFVEPYYLSITTDYRLAIDDIGSGRTVLVPLSLFKFGSGLFSSVMMRTFSMIGTSDYLGIRRTQVFSLSGNDNSIVSSIPFKQFDITEVSPILFEFTIPAKTAFLSEYSNIHGGLEFVLPFRKHDFFEKMFEFVFGSVDVGLPGKIISLYKSKLILGHLWLYKKLHGFEASSVSSELRFPGRVFAAEGSNVIQGSISAGLTGIHTSISGQVSLAGAFLGSVGIKRVRIENVFNFVFSKGALKPKATRLISLFGSPFVTARSLFSIRRRKFVADGEVFLLSKETNLSRPKQQFVATGRM
jgi:hypothetical protein